MQSNTSDMVATCPTPDAQYVLTGSDDHDVRVYSLVDGGLVRKLTGHIGPVHQVAANPVYEQVASACNHVVLWIPKGGA